VAGERVLTQPELNRAVLARQLLLERAGTPLPRALERVGGIQAQYAPSMYIGLWSRLEGFARDDLTRALERRRVVQGTLMRVTIHLVSRADYWPIASAVRGARRGLWLRTHPGPPDAGRLVAAARTLRSALASTPSGTLRRAEVEERLGKPEAWGVGLWLDLVRAPPSGTWERRRADVYGDAEAWIGPARPGAPDGVELLVRRHLGAFGPAAAGDIATWAGLPARVIAPGLERLDLRRFRGPAGELLLDLPRAPLPHPETPAPVRFLPTYDATLLAHARRAGILPEEHRARVFHTRMPQSVGTFLVDGAVAGTWRLVAGRVTPEPFARLDAATRREVREEAGRLTDFHRAGG
jgi:Winged helix DNA-binding domain